MKAVILVGGESTRLRPLTRDLPKAMVPVANRPFLERMLEWLAAHGVVEIVLTTSYHPEPIEDYFGDGSRHGVEITYVFEPQPLGTGGAIKNCQRLLAARFLALNGDILTDLDLAAVAAEHAARRAQVTIVTTRVDDPSRFGVVVSDEAGRVRQFVEKPQPGQAPSHDINAGIYLFEPEMLREMPEGNFSVERDFFPAALARGARIYQHRAAGYWIDIGTVEAYLKAHWDILEDRLHTAIPGRQERPGIWMAEGAQVDATAHLTPPVVIGPGARVEPGARLGPRAVIGEGAQVGRGAVAAECILWPRSRLEDRATVSGAIIGFDAVVQAGASVKDDVVRSGETAATS